MAREFETRMWIEACEMLDRAQRLHRQFFRLGEGHSGRPSWEPPVDVFETEHELWIIVALPGVEPARLQVAVQDGVLVIQGERGLPAEVRTARLHRMEIPTGRFERRIPLARGVYEIGRRDLANGCLTLTLRRRST